MLGSRGKRRALLAAVSLAAYWSVASGPSLAASAGQPVILYAAPAGSGSACTAGAPCSLLEAQARVRGLTGHMQSDIDVVLAGGTYQLDRTFVLGPPDSGSHGFRVVYTAAAGARPILSGGRTVTGWHPVPGHGTIWQAALPAGFDTRQLYVDGVSAPLAQGLPAATKFVQTSTGFLASSAAMDSWPDPGNINVLFQGGNGPWTRTSCPIASVSGRSIVMSQPCWSNLHFQAEGVQELGWIDDPHGGFNGLSPAATPTAFENAYALLTPGHWAIDRTAHRLYYMAQPGQNPNRLTMVVPALQTLVQVSGSLAAPVHDLVLQGLQFSYGGWTTPDTADGFAQMQADWTLTGAGAVKTEGTCHWSTPAGTCPFASWTRTPANVVVTAARRISILDDTFSHLGGAGLDLYYGSQHDLVQGNEFTDISASAIQLGSTNDPLPADVHAGADEVNAYDSIVDNYVHDVANQYLGGIGIWAGYTAHALIAHNQVDDVPYTAISLGWGGWHANLSRPGIDPNINADNVVSDNVLYHYMTVLGDGGAIYTNGTSATGYATALRLSGNVAYDGPNSDFSLYTDTGSQYIYITANLVYDQPFDSFDTGGCHTIGHIHVDGNYFAPGGPGYPCYPYTDVQTANDTTICEDPPPDQVPTAILRAAGLEAADRGLVDRHPPALTMIGPGTLPLSGGAVLISGSGFQPHTSVRFGGMPAAKVQVLSANYILATAPPGTGAENVVATTSSGNSNGLGVTYAPVVTPCVDYLGGGFSTALFTG